MKGGSWLPVGALFLQALTGVYGATIDADCTGDDRANVEAALASVVRMATYAVGRAADTDPNHHQGSILQDMVGGTSQTDAQALQIVGQWMGRVVTTAGADATAIHCKDEHLTTINAAEGRYVDKTRGNAVVMAPRRPGETLANQGACGGVNEAFTYSTVQGPVIVLCSDSPKGALRNMVAAHFDHLRTGSDLRDTAGTKAEKPWVGIDYFGRYLNYKLWHEMMHAAGMQQFAARLPDPDANGQVIPEQYRYKGITGANPGEDPTLPSLSPNNKQHNADGFALLGCGWYLPRYKWSKGMCLSQATNPPPDSYAQAPAKMIRRERRHFLF